MELPAHLPPEQVPFPVESTYRIRPDLRKLEPGEQRFVLDRSLPHYRSRKLELLSSFPQQCRVFNGTEERLRCGLWRVAELLASEHPEECRLDGNVATFPRLGIRLDHGGELEELESSRDQGRASEIAEHLEALGSTARLADALALAVQEDLVLIAGPAGADSSSMLHVCFPSHWNPGQRSGASFVELHEPVPHNERLIAGSRNLVSAMLTKGPFVRHVWSVTTSHQLDQNPARSHQPAPLPDRPLVDSLYFRAERQTTTALGGLALFTIRIYVSPLRGVLDPIRARLLGSAIRSMDAELLRYKSLVELKEPLLEELDALAAASRGLPRVHP